MPTGASTPLRVLLVSADPLVRAGLRAVLEKAGWALAAEVDSLGRARAAWLELPFDAILWDAGPTPVLEAGEAGAAPVVALVEDERAARAVLAAGAAGALLRAVEPATVGAALLAVTHGLTVSDASFHHLRPLPELPAAASPGDFTPREREVLALLAEGLPNRTIAERLGISRHTVKFHVNALLQKLGVERRTEAVVRAARLGLVVL
ncbi:MAG: LuxR C-terminal-related transcriptional regulator [Myxococcaceae bacterium]